jgi:hypothetical protein
MVRGETPALYLPSELQLPEACTPTFSWGPTQDDGRKCTTSVGALQRTPTSSAQIRVEQTMNSSSTLRSWVILPIFVHTLRSTGRVSQRARYCCGSIAPYINVIHSGLLHVLGRCSQPGPMPSLLNGRRLPNPAMASGRGWVSAQPHVRLVRSCGRSVPASMTARRRCLSS